MKVIAFTCVLLAFAACTFAEEQVSYSNYKVYQVTPKNAEELDIVRSLERIDSDVDFWSEARSVGHAVDIMVSPRFQGMITYTLQYNKIEFRELISDVEKAFNAERLRQILAPRTAEGRISFTQYQRYDVIGAYLKSLANDYDFVTVETPGKTSQGRPLYLLKIATGGKANKPTILVDGGIHAREWIAPAMVLYIINQLVENKNNAKMIENTDWLIVPVLNPDGYEYSHSTERLWRKTRSAGRNCVGTDANRNFDFHWMETGASSNECSETYAGPYGSSEPEVQTLQRIVKENADRIKLYLTFHSYGQYLLYPWGWTSGLPSDWKELQALGEKVDDAIASVAGTRYEIGSSTNVLYAAAGGSDDWVKGVGGVQLSYTIELPGGGIWGFDLPPSKISSVVKETFEGIKVYQAYVENKFLVN